MFFLTIQQTHKQTHKTLTINKINKQHQIDFNISTIICK